MRVIIDSEIIETKGGTIQVDPGGPNSNKYELANMSEEQTNAKYSGDVKINVEKHELIEMSQLSGKC